MLIQMSLDYYNNFANESFTVKLKKIIITF